jgi:hypothetical protein
MKTSQIMHAAVRQGKLIGGDGADAITDIALFEPVECHCDGSGMTEATFGGVTFPVRCPATHHG